MASNRVGRRVHKDPGPSLQRARARVTVKYNRRELQRRLEVEKWLDGALEQLYRGREEEMPEEVNIDELLDLKTDVERTHRLQDILQSCNSSSEEFISELLLKLHGLQKHEDLHNDGIDLPQLHIYPVRSASANREVLH